MALFGKLKQSLKKTRDNFTGSLKSIFNNKKGLTEDIIDELEETLVTGDIGVETSMNMIHILGEKLKKERDLNYEEVISILKDEVTKEVEPILQKRSSYSETTKPYVILVVGVNGTGKTTSIGKLAFHYKNQGKRVLLAAADTFRAAAVEQLEVWKERIGVEIIKNKEGTDPAAVAFDSIESAKARGMDVLIIDTAGRIHTNTNLMQELEKIKRVVQKVLPGAPHKTLLVIDGNTGQNAITQAKSFVSRLEVDGLVLTKLDGTAKGGVAIPIMKDLGIPIEFIGVGEQKEDLELFNIKEFVEALFD